MIKIRFGLSATLTGSYSLQGSESLNGLILWSEFQNISGGVFIKEAETNVPVELIYFDDGSIPENTSSITKRLIAEENVDFLLGPYSSSLGLASAKVAEKYDRILWNYGASTDELLSDEYTNTVNFITPASRYFHPFLDLIKHRQPLNSSIAIVFAEDSGFSRQVSGGAKRYSEELGITYKVYTYMSGTDKFPSILEQIKKSNIEIVIGVGRFEDDLRLAKYLKGFNACLVGAGIEQFKNLMGNESEGFISISQWEPGINFNPDFGISSKQFTKLYLERFGKLPDYTSAQSFNIGNILAHYIEYLGTLDEHKLRKKIINSSFSTFYGDFATDLTTNTQTGHTTVVTQWQNGRKEIIYPPEYSTSYFKEPL